MELEKTQVDADAAEEAAMPYGAAQLVLGMATTNQKVGTYCEGTGPLDNAARLHADGRLDCVPPSRRAGF